LARPLLVLLLGAFGIACAAIFVRLALPAPPVVTGFWRLALATSVLAAVLAPRLRLRVLPRRAALEALAAGACFGADLALWNTALVETSVATATLLVNTTPLFVGAFAVLVLSERVGARLALGAGFALGGAALLLGDDLGARASLRGGGLALGAAVFYSAYLLWIQRARRALDAATSVAISGAASTLVLGAAALLRGDPLTGFPAQSWLVFGASAVVSHLAGVVGIVWALAHLRATFAAVALLAQPLGTALLGWWWLGEALSPLQLAGGALVVAGIALAGRAREAEPAGTLADGGRA
jgi:drug/metabolite transporter (DMT)-like permease